MRAALEKTQAAAAEATAILAAPLVLQANETPIEIPVADDRRRDHASRRTPPTASPSASIPRVFGRRSPPRSRRRRPRRRTPRSRSSNGAPSITPSSPGRTVDWPATDAGIDPALRSAEHVLPVVYVVTEPELTTEKAQALGINSVIGEFTTGGFEYASGQNIETVAAEGERRDHPAAQHVRAQRVHRSPRGRAGLHRVRHHPGRAAGPRRRRRHQPVRDHPVQRRVLRRAWAT